MLSLSADMLQEDVDLQVVNGNGDGGVQYGAELSKFAEAVASQNEPALTQARKVLFDAAGSDVLVDAAGVAGNFQRMVRIADATGIPVDGMMGALSGSIQDDLNLRRFESSHNTPVTTLLQKLIATPLRLLAPIILRAGERKAKRQ
ncbi:MAG: hypothetical protein ACI9JM_000408 [Halioglobus sp.]|jgi:hypothetical protein